MKGSFLFLWWKKGLLYKNKIFILQLRLLHSEKILWGTWQGIWTNRKAKTSQNAQRLSAGNCFIVKVHFLANTSTSIRYLDELHPENIIKHNWFGLESQGEILDVWFPCYYKILSKRIDVNMFKFYNVLFLKVVTITKRLSFYGLDFSERLRCWIEERYGHFYKT